MGSCKDRVKKELDEANDYIKWLEAFSGTIYELDKDLYDKASKVAYELRKIAKKKEKK